MNTTPTNPLRKGSAGYEAIEAVRRHGPLMPAALAMEIDKPLDEIDQLLRFPVREGLLHIDADGCYALGSGKAAEAAPAAPAPAPAPAAAPAPAPAAPADLGEFVRQRIAKAADDLQGPAPGTAHITAGPLSMQVPTSKIGEAVKALGGQAVQEQPKPEPARRSPAARPVDIDAVHRRTAAAPAPAARASDFVAAWCSDGTYVIKKGSVGIELSQAEMGQLFQHLSAVARVAA